MSFQSKFNKTLQLLNSRQREAVEATEGPVIALAGPGTGKTHVLTTRIAQILQKTDAEAHNILCLTFTDAGVLSMRQKLVELIGPAAHKVPIYTFHSFCNKVIKENLEVFGNRHLRAISSLDKLELIRSLIDKLDASNPLKKHKSNPYFYEKHLKNLFQIIKKEQWTEQHLIDKIEQYLQDLPLREEMRYKRNSGINKKGDVKKGEIEKISTKIDLLLHAIPVYQAYQVAMQAHQFYDFEDMILWVIDAFEQEEWLLRVYQEQFLYLMVDEFQDTNGAQSKIVELLMQYWGDNPNLFIVGDDDQSIYEFQGARLKNLTDLMDRYQNNLNIIQLDKNYRSSQRILNVAKESIDHNKIRVVAQSDKIVKDKILQASLKDVADLKQAVRLVEFDNPWQEEVGLLRQIETLIEQGVAADNIAIIFAKHKQASNLIHLMDKKGMPYQVKKKKDVLQMPLLYNLRKLLEYIQLSSKNPLLGDTILFELLHINFLNIDADAISKMTWWMHQKRDEASSERYWYHLIGNIDLLEELGIHECSNILNFSNFIKEAKLQLFNLNIVQFIEFVIHNSGLTKFLYDQKNRLNAIKVVHSLIYFTQECFDNNHRLDLKGLLQKFDMMQANAIRMDMIEVNAAKEGVQLLTAHASKGLEFDYVFMLDVVEQKWAGTGQNRNHFHYPDTLTFSNESDVVEAQRRLFYVAMTRARKFLQISYSSKDKKAKKQPRLKFIDELEVDTDNLEYSKNKVAIEEATQMLMISDKKPILNRNHDKAIIKQLLQGFKMTISALNSYVNCPLSFYFEYILKIPYRKSVDAHVGDCFHKLNQLIINYRTSNDKMPDLDWVREKLDIEFSTFRHLVADDVFSKLKKEHLTIYLDYYKARKSEWHKTAAERTILCEKAIWDAEIEGIPLKGIIDKLEIDRKNNSIHLVDYKFSKNQKKKFSVPKKEHQTGGNYWRQLYFYKLLLKGSGQYTERIESACIDFMQQDSNQEFGMQVVEYDDTAMQFMKKILQSSYQSIMRQEFEEGCGKEHCNWCNFVKNNANDAVFEQTAIEEADDVL